MADCKIKMIGGKMSITMKESINKTFNQFKIHTQYSICEGAVKIDQLKDFCKNKIKSLGLSDTYNLSGALEFSENLSSVGTHLLLEPRYYLNIKNLRFNTSYS